MFGLGEREWLVVRVVCNGVVDSVLLSYLVDVSCVV